MSNVNANINVLINTQGAVGGLRALQSQINNFNQSIAASNAAMATSQKQLTANLASQIAATGAFTTSFQKVETSASRLQTAIDKNRLTLGEYFKYGIASSGAFGRVFQKEHNEVMDLATDRVKRLQTQYLALGRAQNGMVDTMAVRPLQLHNADAAVGIQRQQLFNKLLRDGATSMVNWGKNTQWAGRQLMVGFTVPLTIFGGYAASVFMDLDKQITQFRRVYGDAMTPTAEADAMVAQIQDLAKEYTKYGITVADSIEMAAKAAATGLQQDDLLAATEEALRLATLGQMDYQQALDATISLQSAFAISSEDLATEIDFLNATENQTIVSLDDISQAIPRVAPVIKGLGGDVRDLAAMLAAMREGGVNAAEGANALKSGLASLINPSNQANEVLSEMGINIDEIVKKNEGDLMGTVQDFALAIKDLSNLDRQKALATLFGKYQFARMGALFKNIIRDGSQAQRVIDLAGMSVQELAKLSEKDLARLEESVGTRFLGAFERFKLAIAPIGEEFLKIATPILDWVTSIFERFNELSPEVKKWGLILVGALGGVLPIFVMVAGLFGNFLGNMVKGGAIIKSFFGRIARGGRGINYMEGELLDSVAATNSLEGATNGVTQALNVQRGAVQKLAQAYETFLRGAAQSISSLPTMITTPKVVPAPSVATPAVPTSTRTTPVTTTRTAAQTVTESKYTGSYRRKGIAAHLEDFGLPGEQEVARATQAHEGAKQGIKEYYRVVYGEIPDDIDAQLEKGNKVVRAHLEQVDKSIDKEVPWHPALWVPQSEIENQFSEVMRKNANNREFMGRYMDALTQEGVTQDEIDVIKRKQMDGLALNERELQVQAMAIRRMQADVAAEPEKFRTTKRGKPTDPFTPTFLKYAYGAEAAAAARARSATPEIIRDPAQTALAKAEADALRDRIQAENLAEQSSRKVAASGESLDNAQRKAAAAHSGAAATAPGKTPARPLPAYPETPAGPNIDPRKSPYYASMAAAHGADMEKISQSGRDLEKDTKESGGIIKRGAKAFGNSLVNGSGKMQGGLFALDGLVIGLSMMDNQVGEFANSIMPAVFAIQGITMMLPMLTNPIGAVAGGLALVAGSAIAFNMITDNARQEMQNMIESLMATRSTIDQVGEFFGRESLASQARERTAMEVAGPGVESEQIQQAREFLETGIGKTLQTGFTDAIQQMGTSAAAEQFAANLASMVLQGVMSPEEAKAISSVIGESIGNETVGMQINGKLKQLIGPNGQDITKSPLDVALRIDRQNQETFSTLTQDFDNLTTRLTEFNQVTLTDIAASFIPVFGAVNMFNKLTLGLEGFWGDVARGARGLLNPDDFELVNQQLEGIGGLIGNQLAQGYENLASAQERILSLEEQARKARNDAEEARRKADEAPEDRGLKRTARKKEDVAYEAEADVRRAKRGEEQLKQSLERNKQQAIDMFRQAAEQGNQAVTTALTNGINKSIENTLKDDPFQQAIYDAIDFGGMTPEIAFALRAEVASGALPPSSLQSLIDLAGGGDQAYRIITEMSAQLGGDTPEAIRAINTILGSGIEDQAVQLDLITKMQGMNPKQLNSFLSTMNQIAGITDQELKKKLAFVASGMNQKELKQLNRQIEIYQGYNNESLQKEAEIIFDEYGLKGLKEAQKTFKEFDQIEDPKKKVSFVTENFDLTKEQMQEFKDAVKDGDEELQAELIAKYTVEGLKAPKDPVEIPAEYVFEGGVGGGDFNAPPIKLTANSISVDDNTVISNVPELDLTASGTVDMTAADTTIGSHIPPRINTAVLGPNMQVVTDTVNNYTAPTIRVPVEYYATNSPNNPTRGFTGGAVTPKGFATGGQAEQTAGLIPGDGSRDSVLALLAPGEYVMRKSTVEKYGAGFFRALNMSAYAAGGSVGIPSSIPRFQKGGEAKEEKQKEIKDALKGFKENLVEMVKTFVGINMNLKDFLKGTATLAKSVVKGGGLEQALRNTGMTESAIEQILSMGADAAKKWYDKNIKKGDLTKQGRGQVAAMNAAFVGQQMSGYQARARTAQAQTRVTSYLTRRGASQSMIDEIGGNEESAQAYNLLLQQRAEAERKLAKAQKSGDKGAIKKAQKDLQMANKAIGKYEQGVRKATQAEEAMAKALDPVGWAIDKIDQAREQTLNKFGVLEAKFAAAFGAMERAARPGIEAAQKAVEAAEDNVEAIQDQIDAIEEKNEADQFEIRGLERSKDLIQRKIDANDRLNEADQRRIDKLQREDEIRSRSADALERELTQLSNQETKIQEAYQDRIDALDKVSSINQNILDQQKSMLNIGQSLAQGDVYAAAQAIQERRAQQAQFAADQARQALESASENAVANLRTSSGLTREEAEARIESIREQSYQTSLKIRDIEDEIYKRNQLNVPLMDQMRTIDDQILVIQDRIYNRETQILTIQRDQLKPAEKALEDAQKILTAKEEKLENDKANLKIDGLTYDQLQDQIASEAEAYDLAVAQIKANEENLKSIENIVRKWEDVSKAIAKANKLARTRGEDERGVARSAMNRIENLLEKGKITKKEAEDRKKEVRDRLRQKLDEIEQQRKAAIDAARQRGIDNQRAYADSTYYRGGSVRRYAAGSFISGDGARDSVSALLSPGEYVMRRAAVNKYGLSMMESINSGSFALPSYSMSAPSSSVSPSSARVNTTSNFSPVYNSYGINVNVSGTNASADEIANRTVSKIREMQNMRIRSARV